MPCESFLTAFLLVVQGAALTTQQFNQQGHKWTPWMPQPLGTFPVPFQRRPMSPFAFAAPWSSAAARKAAPILAAKAYEPLMRAKAAIDTANTAKAVIDTANAALAAKAVIDTANAVKVAQAIGTAQAIGAAQAIGTVQALGALGVAEAIGTAQVVGTLGAAYAAKVAADAREKEKAVSNFRSQHGQYPLRQKQAVGNFRSDRAGIHADPEENMDKTEASNAVSGLHPPEDNTKAGPGENADKTHALADAGSEENADKTQDADKTKAPVVDPGMHAPEENADKVQDADKTRALKADSGKNAHANPDENTNRTDDATTATKYVPGIRDVKVDIPPGQADVEPEPVISGLHPIIDPRPYTQAQAELNSVNWRIQQVKAALMKENNTRKEILSNVRSWQNSYNSDTAVQGEMTRTVNKLTADTDRLKQDKEKLLARLQTDSCTNEKEKLQGEVHKTQAYKFTVSATTDNLKRTVDELKKQIEIDTAQIHSYIQESPWLANDFGDEGQVTVTSEKLEENCKALEEKNQKLKEKQSYLKKENENIKTLRTEAEEGHVPNEPLDKLSHIQKLMADNQKLIEENQNDEEYFAANHNLHDRANRLARAKELIGPRTAQNKVLKQQIAELQTELKDMKSRSWMRGLTQVESEKETQNLQHENDGLRQEVESLKAELLKAGKLVPSTFTP